VTTRDPGPNKVLFVLAMPDNYNSRYVYLGVGGAGGQLPTLPPGLLAKGYVLAGSDGGSGAKSGADFSFKNDPGKTMDFVEGRGVHVTAVATQAIARKYYGSDQLRRYVNGCSGGGQMGLGNARRLGGEDFDAFLVGATPWPTTAYMPHIFRIARHLQTSPQGWISPDLMKKARVAILATYDGSDGVVDGIIADQRNITSFDTGILSNVGFSPAQIETFELIRRPYAYSGKGLIGSVTNPGFPITDVGGWSSFLLGSSPPPWPGSDTATPAGGALHPHDGRYQHAGAASGTNLLVDREFERTRPLGHARRPGHAIQGSDGLQRPGPKSGEDDRLSWRE
jgi:feruloyl esterase